MSDKADNKPVTFSSLLESDNEELGNLYRHIALLSDLENRLLSFLGTPLSDHCKIANYTNGMLILHSDSPAWAAKLRYSTPAILQFLQNKCHLDALNTIRIKVNPPVIPDKPVPARKLTLSSSSAEFISQVANTMADENIRQSLLKIVQQKKI